MTQKIYFIIWFVYGVLIEKFPCKTFLIKLNISENKGSGEDIIDLKSYIIREKLPINSSGTYNIIPNNLSKYFVLQKQTGLLKQGINIDRETICQHTEICQKFLLILINKQLLEVIFNIEDENDNVPQFSMRNKTLSIKEHSDIGSKLYLPTAYDLDTETNRINRYFIKDVNLRENILSNQYQASKYFNFSVETMNRIKMPYLKLKKEIDREEIERFELILIAEDSGKQQGSCTITISIIDINDNSPQWPTVNISKKVKEYWYGRTLILELQAFDRDDSSTLNGQIRYKISDHSPKIELINKLFCIVESRLYLINQGLQFLDTEYHISFFITAVDGGGRENDTKVTIEFENCYVKYPFISIHKPTVSVKENDRSSIILTSLTVKDDNKCSNSEFNCKLNDTSFFIITKYVYNQSNGIQVFLYYIKKIPDKFFDRETISFYSVLIRCRDIRHRLLIVQDIFSVTIVDENDNSPIFTADEIKFSIAENNSIGASIGYVEAKDRDSNENGRVTYHIVNNEKNYFTITSLGKIETNLKFDREIKETYYLTIMAKDNGEPSRNDTCTVVITILDVNDCDPVFKQQYFYQITEGNGLTTSHSILGKVIAEDNDKGENGTVYYAIRPKPETDRQNNNGFNLLKINLEGVLNIYGVVDREKMEAIQAEIVAFDNGRPQLSAVANIIVEVLDVNDNKPKFKYPLGKMNYINISTDTEIGKELAKFEAEDPDQGENGTISYTIISHENVEQNLPFQLHNDGHLVLIKSLKERDDILRLPDRLIIRASDNGNPPKSASITVNIRYNKNKKDQKSNLWPSGNQNRFNNENYRENDSIGLTLLYILIGVLFIVFIILLLFLVYTYISRRFSKNRQFENNNVNLPLNKWSSIQYNPNFNQSLSNRESIPARSSIFQTHDNSNYAQYTQNRAAEPNDKSVIDELANKWNSFENIIPSNNGNNSLIRSQENGFFYNAYSCAANINRFREEEKDYTSSTYDNIDYNKITFNQRTLPTIHNQKLLNNEQMFATYQPKYTQRNMVVSTFV